MILDANNYDKGMANAQKSVANFIQQNMTLGGVLGTAGKALGTFAAAAGVAGGALEAAKKTIASTQTLTDKFEASMMAAKSAVDSLFYSMASGNWDNFLDGLKDTVRYAQAAAAALDDLGTFQIFAGASNAELKNRREDLKAQIKTGYRYEAGADGSVSRIKMSNDEIEAAKAELKEVQAEYIRLIRQTQEKELESYQAVARQILKENKFKGTEEEMDKAVAYYLKNYNKYSEVTDKLAELNATIAANTETAMVYDQFSQANILKRVPNATASAIMNSDEYSQLQALYEIGDDKLKALLQHRINAAMAGATLSSELRSDAKVLDGKSGGGTEKWRPKHGIGPAEDKKGIMTETEVYLANIDDLEFAEVELMDLNQEITTNMAKAWENYLKDLEKRGGEIQDILYGMGNAFGELGRLIGGTTGDNIAAIGEFLDAAQGMIPVIQSMTAAKKLEEQQAENSAAAKLEETAAGAGNAVANIPIAGPALAIAAITSVLSMAAAIKSIKFAEGGVVPGNNYTDGIGAKVSAGEVILNSHDAKNLYDQIHSGNLGGGGGAGYVSGENIYIGLNNYLARSGKGRLVVR